MPSPDGRDGRHLARKRQPAEYIQTHSGGLALSAKKDEVHERRRCAYPLLCLIDRDLGGTAGKYGLRRDAFDRVLACRQNPAICLGLTAVKEGTSRVMVKE